MQFYLLEKIDDVLNLFGSPEAAHRALQALSEEGKSQSCVERSRAQRESDPPRILNWLLGFKESGQCGWLPEIAGNVQLERSQKFSQKLVMLLSALRKAYAPLQRERMTALSRNRFFASFLTTNSFHPSTNSFHPPEIGRAHV